MIIYGISMQDKPHQVPEEVAVWLLEQNVRYPNIDFKIDYSEFAGAETEEVRKKYSRTWNGAPTGLSGHGVGTVGFLYLRETWFIKIIGGLDAEGNIADMSIARDSDDPKRSIAGLSAELRAEISTMPPLEDLEEISEKLYGLPRKQGESVQERGTLIEVPADMSWKSDFMISGAELADLFHGQPSERKTQIVEALSRKDYETAKRLLGQRN